MRQIQLFCTVELFSPWRSYLCLYTTTVDFVFDTIEGKFRAQELKELPSKVAGDVWLEVEQVKVGLVIDDPALTCRQRRYFFAQRRGKVADRERILRVL
jgi:hypothetical protein